MDTRLMLEVQILRACLKGRDRWSSQQIQAHQDRSLAHLRRRAYSGSEFYREHHAGLVGAPLSELPPVTKTQLMENFDRVVTDSRVRLAGIEDHLQELVSSNANPGKPWRRRWWAAATAGTTGQRGIFVWNRHEWSTVLASYARANDWAGVSVGPTRPLRMAVVSSRTPTHQSAVVGASVQSRLVPTLRLDATASMSDVVAELNIFQPRLLVGYASTLKPLAAEQRAGRLRIAPQSVMSASEVLSANTATEIQAAWGSDPFDIYAATETAGIASPCTFHNSHIYEDLVIVESVDVDGRAVPSGTTGAKILATVLFSRTLPLIRYEISDSVRVNDRGCPCGRSFALLDAIEGRAEDVLQLPGTAGSVSIHPNLFHNVLDEATVKGWQVSQEPTYLRVTLVGLRPAVSAEQIRQSVAEALTSAGVAGIDIVVDLADDVERTTLGKAPLVRGLPKSL